MRLVSELREHAKQIKDKASMAAVIRSLLYLDNLKKKDYVSGGVEIDTTGLVCLLNELGYSKSDGPICDIVNLNKVLKEMGCSPYEITELGETAIRNENNAQ